jgi:hypothetical protein
MTEAEIMANYGRAAVNLEIAQGQFNEAKRAVKEFLDKQNKPVEAEAVKG